MMMTGQEADWIVADWQAGRKLPAIKMLRQLTGLSLRESKEYLENNISKIYDDFCISPEETLARYKRELKQLQERIADLEWYIEERRVGGRS